MNENSKQWLAFFNSLKHCIARNEETQAYSTLYELFQLSLKVEYYAKEKEVNKRWKSTPNILKTEATHT